MTKRPAPKTTQEEASLESRLAAAEWTLERLAETDGEMDLRVKALLEDAVDEVERIWADGREKVESLVRDAEDLRTLAAKQASEVEASARAAVAEETKELLENASRLQVQADEKAAQIIAEAKARAAATDREIDERLAEAEVVYEKVERHIAAREEILDEVRKRADQIIRNAKTTAATVIDEANASAKRITDNATNEANVIIQAARDDARQRMERVTAQEIDAKERLEKARSQAAAGR